MKIPEEREKPKNWKRKGKIEKKKYKKKWKGEGKKSEKQKLEKIRKRIKETKKNYKKIVKKSRKTSLNLILKNRHGKLFPDKIKKKTDSTFRLSGPARSQLGAAVLYLAVSELYYRRH